MFKRKPRSEGEHQPNPVDIFTFYNELERRISIRDDQLAAADPDRARFANVLAEEYTAGHIAVLRDIHMEADASRDLFFKGFYRVLFLFARGESNNFVTVSDEPLAMAMMVFTVATKWDMQQVAHEWSLLAPTMEALSLSLPEFMQGSPDECFEQLFDLVQQTGSGAGTFQGRE